MLGPPRRPRAARRGSSDQLRVGALRASSLWRRARPPAGAGRALQARPASAGRRRRRSRSGGSDSGPAPSTSSPSPRRPVRGWRSSPSDSRRSPRDRAGRQGGQRGAPAEFEAEHRVYRPAGRGRLLGAARARRRLPGPRARRRAALRAPRPQKRRGARLPREPPQRDRRDRRPARRGLRSRATTCASASTSSSCTPERGRGRSGCAEPAGEEGDDRRLQLRRGIPHRPVAAFLEDDHLGAREGLLLALPPARP